MPPLFNQSLAGCVAIFLALSSIGAIVTVPPAQAHASLTLPAFIELA